MTEKPAPGPDLTIPQDGAPGEDLVEERPSGEIERIVIPRGRKLTESEKAMMEFGQDLIKDSVTQTVEFHKTMLGLTATFATLMASSFAILTVGSGDQPLDGFQRFLSIVPVVLMMLSAVCFALGYYPRRLRFRANDLSEIEEVRNKVLRSRGFWAICGVALFILSIVSLLIGIVAYNVA